jgi:antitoxin ParD1/3/4
MNVSLTPELETLIDQKVKSGLYNSASDVLREALRLLDEHDRGKERRREALRKEVTKGIEEIKAGRYVTLETQKDFDALAEHTKQEGRTRLARRKSGY